jgi:hypothetical protein
LKNNADLEESSLHYIAENIQDQLPVHDFIAKGMNEVDFEKWLKL